MKFNPDHKPTGDAAKSAKLPDGFAITGAIRRGTTVYTAGQEDEYAASKPSQADVDRLAASGAIKVPDAKK